MTINLPDDLENRVQAAVHSGRFASVDDAMAEAARLLLRQLDRGQQAESPGNAGDPGPDPFLGSLRDAADELNEIVADAYRNRREETWRDAAVE
jgi:Arc/MetJ-type ribon-helix-helix transcriptional regulator